MGSDDLFKKRRAERQQRKHEFKIPKANSLLKSPLLMFLEKAVQQKS